MTFTMSCCFTHAKKEKERDAVDITVHYFLNMNFKRNIKNTYKISRCLSWFQKTHGDEESSEEEEEGSEESEESSSEEESDTEVR